MALLMYNLLSDADVLIDQNHSCLLPMLTGQVKENWFLSNIKVPFLFSALSKTISSSF